MYDNQAPVITCPAAVAANTAAGSAKSAKLTLTATATDNVAVLGFQGTKQDFFPVGATTVSFSATDGIFTSSCNVVVTVTDGEAPTFDNCPASPLQLVTGNSKFGVTNLVITARDNVDGVVAVPGGDLSTYQFPITTATQPATHVKLTAQDSRPGTPNKATCEFDVVVTGALCLGLSAASDPCASQTTGTPSSLLAPALSS